jgi:hypothetical protein
MCRLSKGDRLSILNTINLPLATGDAAVMLL